MYCAHCGHALTVGDERFCPACGTAVPAADPSLDADADAAVGSVSSTVGPVIPGPSVDPRAQVDAGSGSGWSRRNKSIAAVVGVLVIAGATTGIVIASSGASHPSAAPGTDLASAPPSTITTAAAACQLEANVIMDVTVSGSYNATDIENAIGDVTPLFRIGEQLYSTWEVTASQYGQAEAETRIAPVIQTACTQANNPLLTNGQLQSLSQLANTTDANYLTQIQTFSSGQPSDAPAPAAS